MSRKPKGFVLAVGKRPSGATFWIARGTIGGKQERREFSRRDDALAFIEQKNSELHGYDAERTQVVTRLKPNEIQDAEIAVAQIAREFPGKSLLEIVDYYRQLAPVMTLADAAQFSSALGALRQKYPAATLPEVCAWFTQHFRPAKNSITLKLALEHYLADVYRRKNKGSLSIWQLNSIGFATAQLESFFGADTCIADLTTFRLNEYLKKTTKGRDGSDEYANKTWSNRRGYLTTFFKYCLQEGWLDENPAKGIKNYTKKEFNRPPPSVLTAKEAEKLMTYLEKRTDGRMIPFFVLTLFCGIRPTWWNGEVARVKLKDFNFTQGILTLRAGKTKTKKTRIVRLQPNVIRWLEAYPPKKHPIIARNFKKLYFKIRKDFNIGYDALRHTYCSMLVGKFRSVGDAALQAGNSEEVLWSNYLNLVFQEEAEAFWNIFPRNDDLSNTCAGVTAQLQSIPIRPSL